MADKPVFTGVLQIGMVVKNCDEAVRKYADDYGIGPWNIYEFNPDTVSDMIIEGKEVKYAMRLALCNIGDVQWELIEPKDDKSIYASFLKEHGGGLHHVAFGTDNYEKTVQFYKDKGRPVLQGGTWKGLTYTYLDSREDLGVIAEIYNLVPDFKWPEPEGVYPEK
ncbi:MAG: VOC family protein [Geobacteraceae bacterium]|nr:VOC family protein [Geobacteraceae bacterium]